jgi:cytochrome b
MSRSIRKQGEPGMIKTSERRTVVVWDLPTRLFHWLLVCLVAVSFVTAEIGGNAMRVHEASGFTILALLLFRLVWGMVGSTPSRFRTFIVGPRKVIAYTRTMLRRDGRHHLTHNPLGGWSVVAMLAALLLQAGTGLFATDDILTQGPLYRHVSSGVSHALTEFHEFNAGVIVALVGVHIAAVVFHLLYKRDNLVLPMLTGSRPWDEPVADFRKGPLWLAAAVAAMAAAAVWWIVR